MTGDILLFAGMIAAPAAAMLCPAGFLYFFLFFPFSAALERCWAWFGRFAVLALTPSFLMVITLYRGNNEAASASLRWVCALGAGSFFAASLSTCGIARVLKAFSADRLAQVLLLCGDTARRTRVFWKAGISMPMGKRAVEAITRAVESAASETVRRSRPGPLAITAAALSWVFFLMAVSGRLE